MDEEMVNLYGWGLETRRYGGLEDTMGDGASLAAGTDGAPAGTSSRQLGSRREGRGPIAVAASTLASTVAQIAMILFTSL